MAGERSRQGREGTGRFGDVLQAARDAEAAEYEGVRQAIRVGKDLQLKTPSEVLAYGVSRLQAEEARVAAAASKAVGAAKRQAGDALNGLARDPRAMVMAGDVARGVGNTAGLVRGGANTVTGLVDGVAFVRRLTDPADVFKSPPGQSATVQLGRGMLRGGQAVAGYAQKAIANPQSVVTDVRDQARQWRRDLDPSATPMAPNLEGELRRNFDIGQNQGELAFNVGSLVVGGPAAVSVGRIGGFSRAVTAEKYLAQGFNYKAAAYLAEPYPSSAMGHHYIPRRTKLPKFLGGKQLPRKYSDGPFNKLAPTGITRGGMYELHHMVDPDFHGTKLPARVGGGRWSGKALGLKRYNLAGRIWHGSPAPLKARIGGLGAAAGTAMHGEGGGGR